MFLCVLVDNNDVNFGPDSLGNETTAICVSDSVDEIKKHIADEYDDGNTVKWRYEEDQWQWIGDVVGDIDEEQEEDPECDSESPQYYIICEIAVV